MKNNMWKLLLSSFLCTLMMSVVFVTQASSQERPPDWMWGEWRGYDSNAKRDCEWYISSDGDAAFGYVGEKRQMGFYRDGRLYLDKYTYTVSKSGSNIVVRDVNDRGNTITYRRTSGGGSGGWGGSGGSGGNDQPPDWMIGTFRGYDRNADKDCEWVINRDGSAKFRYKDGNSQSGSYRDGYLKLDKYSYTVSKSGNGIFVRRTDGGNAITYSRVGGSGGWGGSGGSGGSSRPPDWLIGAFQGYDREKGEDCRWTINRDGSARFQYLNSKAESGRYDDGRLFLNKYSYNVNKVGNNIAVRRTDGGSAITYHKVNPDEGWGDHDGGGWGGSGGSGGWGGSGGSNSNDVVPEWAKGKFRGYDPQSGRDLELRIYGDGRVEGEYFARGENNSYTNTGRYDDGVLNISGRSYYVSKSGRGFNMTRTNDSKVQLQFQRIGN